MNSFAPGQTGGIGGVSWRLVRGRKHPEDIRLDILVPDWTALTMGFCGFASEVFYWNENILFPPPHLRGGAMYLDFLKDAAYNGWEQANEKLQAQRRAAAARRAAA